jgi:hypothetical protein
MIANMMADESGSEVVVIVEEGKEGEEGEYHE